MGETLRILRTAVREPLVHFFLAGLLVFVAVGWFADRKGAVDDRIVVDQQHVDRLARQFNRQVGRDPTPAERGRLVDSYIRDELLYREALRLGLDRGDEVVRRRLIQKAEFLLGGPEEDEVAEADLRAYFEANVADFGSEPLVSFEHVYFGSGDAAVARARQALEALATGAGWPPGARAFPLSDELSSGTRSRLVGVFGRQPIVDLLFSGETDRWLGPTESGYGVHLVRIESVLEPVRPTFESARERVLDAMLSARAIDAAERALEDLRDRYEIERDYSAADQSAE